MAVAVEYLSEELIERDADALLAEYAHARGVTIQAPIPIEDIVEKHLKLVVEFDDTHQMFGVPRTKAASADILGAIFFDQQRVVIDESLDPEENPRMEGRYRFTLAHEGGGHWRLHRHLFARDPSQGALFEHPQPPSVVCRSSQSKESIEWQADYYASCLLMPRNLVIQAWRNLFPDGKPRVLKPSHPVAHSFVEIERVEMRLAGVVVIQADTDALEGFAGPLSHLFKVSPIAMRIRLEKLGLLHRSVPQQRRLAERQ